MAQKDLFSRLKRLFSTDVIIRNTGDTQLNVVDVNKVQNSGKFQTNALIDRFNRIYTNPSSTSLYGQQNAFNYQTLRPQLYSEYDVMDTDAIIASALDIIADESTLKNDQGEILSIRSSDEDVQKILYNLFYNVLNIDFNLWTWIRSMCKYGDFFLKLEISDQHGVYNIIPFQAYHMDRQENYDKDNPSAIRFIFNPEGTSPSSYGYNVVPSQHRLTDNTISFDNYEMVHFRLLSDTNFLPYGRSYLEPARKLFKQYTLMEDAMLIHRIVRAPEKRIFYINVGNIAPDDVENFMQRTISKMKRTPYQDPETGEYNLKYNIQNLLEDYFIPVRGGDSNTKIDTLQGLQYDGITDVEYLRDKVFAALKVPKAFMGYEKDLEGKATLAAQDVRFARTIERLQQIITSELYKVALIHLYAHGYRGESLVNFELGMTSPSIIYEQEKMELLRAKVEIATSIINDGILPTDYIYDNIFHLSEDQYDEYRDLLREDAKRKFRITQIESEGNDPYETGKSYGTPHDLATLYGKGRMYTSPDVPPGYDENKDEDTKLGRPEETGTKRGTQDDNFGKDRLGKEANKEKSTNSLKTKFKGNSPLALEGKASQYIDKKMLEKIPTKGNIKGKQLIFEFDKKKTSLLDESNIRK